MEKPSPQSRIEIIDILRGFTLLGIIIVHFSEQYYAGAAPESHPNFTIHFLGDDIIMGFIGVLISGKFYMIFSFLFGLSFFIQLSKSDSSVSFSIRFFWRLLVLGLIGFIHHLHYRGDILTIYAMLGVGLLMCFKFPDKLLLIVALLLVINVPSAIVRGVEALQPAAEQESIESKFSSGDEQNERYYNTVKTGSYLEVLQANLGEFGFKYQFQFASGRIYITLGLFLLGLYAGRKRIFENWLEHIPLFKRLLKQSLWVILGLVIFSALFFGGAEGLGIKLPELIMWLVGGFVMDVFNLALAMIYVAGIIILFQKEKWKKRLMNFYEIGRMGLTTYLMQTFFGVFLFFGIGVGLLGEIGALASVAISIVLFIVQIQFSKWWLAGFKYGIFEWLWRSATYLKWQPLKLI